ncbi:hypothetical protein CBS101457_004557 [Exobasidium rhododendri]|nr:hypothetical protein CBS101457_004557 [Exobasidium rhododendri]
MAAASIPPSIVSNETTSLSSWSNPDSSLLAEAEDGGGERGEPLRNDSGITNPSSFGSIFALLQQNNTPPAVASRSDRLEESAFEAGSNLARLSWLEMDADVEAVRQSSRDRSRSDWKMKPVTSSQHSHSTFSNNPTYCCAHCGTCLALQDELISKAFSGRDGKAFLFFSVVNSRVGPKEDRQLLTGLHTVADLSCTICKRSVGWFYIRAFEASQRYKEGKYILERAMLHKTNNWKVDI